jgi:hypothetical protein
MHSRTAASLGKPTSCFRYVVELLILSCALLSVVYSSQSFAQKPGLDRHALEQALGSQDDRVRIAALQRMLDEKEHDSMFVPLLKTRLAENLKLARNLKPDDVDWHSVPAGTQERLGTLAAERALILRVIRPIGPQAAPLLPELIELAEAPSTLDQDTPFIAQREAIRAIGKAAIPSLVQELQTSGGNKMKVDSRHGWVATLLGEIAGDLEGQGDTSALPDLERALETVHKAHIPRVMAGWGGGPFEPPIVNAIQALKDRRRLEFWRHVSEHRGWIQLAAAVLLLAVLPIVLLFVCPLWNVAVYRFLKLNQIEKIDLPVLGDLVRILLRLLTVLPWIVTHPRTLDAWIAKHGAAIRNAWGNDVGFVPFAYVESDSLSSQFTYIPLPIRVSGALIERPSEAEIRKLVKHPRSTIQIIGPGGAGKTTLARQMGEWTVQNGRDTGLSDHPMLPVWVDEELDPEKKSLPMVVKGKLKAALPDEEIEDDVFFALLKKQRLLVFVDRLSERSSASQQHIQTIYRSAHVGCLVLTSRAPLTIDGGQSVCIYPQPLNSSTLLNFMTGLLAVFMADNGHNEQASAKPFSSIQKQLQLGEKLAALFQLKNEKSEEAVPLVPLPVRLFVEEAVQLLQTGSNLDDLPSSLPDIYLRHLRHVNPQDPTVQDFLDNDKMLKVAKILGKTAVGKDYIPKEFSKNDAIADLKAASEAVSDSSGPIVRLTKNGVLLEKSGGLETRLRFAFDPVAEFLAAVAYAEECGDNAGQWTWIFSQSTQAPEFQRALKLTWDAYGKTKGWAKPLSA